MMAFNEELQDRVAQYDAEIRSITLRLQHLQSLISHAKALLEEETRNAQYPLPVPIIEDDTTGQRGSGAGETRTVPDVVREIIPAKGVIRFNTVRDSVRATLFPDRDPLTVGKLVAAALSREIERGNIERMGRGLYRRRIIIHEDVGPMHEGVPIG
ncbi:MAG: hypothetical protein O3A93_11595 [Chloroflexi bacterium]|nr:hypothetical protein [Chloroflexota bacterium]MDA1271882.1 hypothetical protein [Chloroflexota bacterium]